MFARLRALALAAALAALAAPARAQWPAPPAEPDDDGVAILRNDTVLVNVVVTQGSKYAAGLTAADFAVTEDGAPQTIDDFFAEKTPFAAAILLDTSGSMETRLRLARVAAARFMDRARPEDSVAVYLFGSDVRRLQDFTPGGRDLADGLWDTGAEGITKMYDCLGQATEALARRPEFRRAILLLSDGADNGSAASYDACVRRALAAGITIYTVDVTPIGGQVASQRPQEVQARGVLRGLAEKSGGRFFSSKGGADLNEAFTQIVDEIGHQYTIAYSSTNAKRDGTWRKIGVSCARRDVKLRARDGYQAPTE
jgi:VWFA-related protein